MEMLFALFGGLAMFLYGMDRMSRALQRAAGDAMKRMLARLTATPLLGVLTGLAVTAVLQSSSAATVMVIGFVSAGLLELPRAVAVIYGINIGTTMTAQLIAFDVQTLVYPVLFLGFLLDFAARRPRWQAVGEAVFSFGLLFEGIDILGRALQPLAGQAVFLDWMTRVKESPLLGILLGLSMTMVVQSSSATIALLQNVARQAGPDGLHSMLGLAGAVPVLLGDNIGTTVTALLACIGQGKDAARAALAHSCFNLSGSLLAAALLTVLLVVEGNFTIWEFQVSGNETVPDEAVLRALEDYGITIRTPSLDIDQKDMRNHVLLELEDVVWLAVNVRGCVARVQVVERVRGQDMVEDGPANVVARRPGLVTRVEALGGQAAVVPGDTVTQGQLLISGAVDLDNGGLRWQHGMGRVWARTWYELTAQVPLTVRQRGVPLSSRTRYALDIGKKRIKLYGKGSTLGGDCDKITQYRPVCLPWGLRLPITVAAETVTAYGPSTDVPRSTREARDEGESLLRRQLEELLGDTGTAENVRIDAVEQGSWLLVTLRAECLEEIGREVPLTDD